jgi:hypothetical protein
MPDSVLLRIDPVLLREVKKRGRAEKSTPSKYVETAVREKLRRTQVTLIMHPSFRDSFRKSKSVPVPGETRKDRAARRRLHHLILDAAGIGK